jgi:L-asparaginase II
LATATLLVQVTRNGVVECAHHGSVVALAADGSVVLSAGDVESPILPRSSLKPLQATGMLRAGLDVPGEQLALVCASHSGEPEHLDVVRRLLAGAGLTEADLDNTPGWPLSGAARTEWQCAGRPQTSLTQNCSGKHAGMVAACVAAGWPTQGYRSPDHPLQQLLRSTVEDLTGEKGGAIVVDGCGAPNFATSLVGLARGFATLATSAPDVDEGRCAEAMRGHPQLVGGTGRDVTRLMSGVPGLIAKDGAEGVYAGAMPDGRAFAVKIDDGAGRARTPVAVAALRALGVAAPVLDELETGTVLGHGQPVGEVSALI